MQPSVPVSLYFVAYVLGRLVDRAKEVGFLDGFVVQRDRVSVHHVQFANDTLFPFRRGI